MTLAGIIFTNINDSAVPEFTKARSIASVPFGCRYRLVDFTLSNMVNSEIENVGIATNFNYQSLMDHIGNGKDWDLARRSGGIKLIPPSKLPYTHSEIKSYSTRLEALMSALPFIERSHADYLVMTDCDHICNIDYKDVIEKHIESGSDLTLVTKKIKKAKLGIYKNSYIVRTASDGRITDLEKNSFEESDIYYDSDAELYISMNMFVAKPEYIANVVKEAIIKGYKSFYNDVLFTRLANNHFNTYTFEGWYGVVSSMAAYYSSSMHMLDENVRSELFGNRLRPVLTKVRNSAPSAYVGNSEVRHSLIADGCVIEGKVENSILFRGVKIGKGTVVRNSILWQNTKVGENASLNCVISDKDVTINDGIMLSGHESMPFYISKGKKI